MPPRKTNKRRTGNHPTPPLIQEDPMNEHISYIKFRAAFTTLAHSVSAQNVRPATVQANPVANTAVARILNFT